MSAVTSQPLPFGPLEREKHIQGIFRAFKNRCGPSCECQTHSDEAKSNQVPPDLESEGHKSDLSPHRGIKDMCIQAPAMKHNLKDEAGLQFLSMLETVRQINVTVRPELRGEYDKIYIKHFTDIVGNFCICTSTSTDPFLGFCVAHYFIAELL